MRLTLGQWKRRFVYGWNVGSVRAKRVMRNGVQIWPSDEERVRTLALDMTGLSDEDAAYWAHALDAVAASSSKACYLELVVAGRAYRVGSTYGGYPLVRYELGMLDFGDDGPPLQDVRVGERLELRAVIPGRTAAVFGGSIYGASRTDEVALPMLSGTKLVYQQACAGRGNWSYSRLKVTGKVSGAELLSAGVDKQSRRWVTYSHQVGSIEVRNEGWVAVSTISGSGWMADLRAVYPAFSRGFGLTVTAVTMA